MEVKKMKRNTIIKILLEYRTNYREDGVSLFNACKKVLGKENILDEFLEIRNIIDTELEDILLEEVNENKDNLKSKSWVKHDKESKRYFDSFNGRFVESYKVYLLHNVNELLVPFNKGRNL